MLNAIIMNKVKLLNNDLDKSRMYLDVEKMELVTKGYTLGTILEVTEESVKLKLNNELLGQEIPSVTINNIIVIEFIDSITDEDAHKNALTTITDLLRSQLYYQEDIMNSFVDLQNRCLQFAFDTVLAETTCGLQHKLEISYSAKNGDFLTLITEGDFIDGQAVIEYGNKETATTTHKLYSLYRAYFLFNKIIQRRNPNPIHYDENTLLDRFA